LGNLLESKGDSQANNPPKIPPAAPFYTCVMEAPQILYTIFGNDNASRKAPTLSSRYRFPQVLRVHNWKLTPNL